MSIPTKIFLLIFCGLTGSSVALEKLPSGGRTENRLVGISGLNHLEWHKREGVCFFESGREADDGPSLCGRVVVKAPTNLIVQVVWVRNQFPASNQTLNATRVSTGVLPNVPPVDVPGDRLVYLNAQSNRNQVSLGLQLLNPSMSYEFLWRQRWAFGLKALYFGVPTVSGSLGGLALVPQVTFYPFEPFKKLFVTTGIGVTSYQAKLGLLQESAFNLIFTASAGWRWRFGTRFSFGAFAGLDFIPAKKFTVLTIRFNGLLPYLGVQLGYVY